MNGISVFAGGKAGRSQHFTGLARKVGVLRQSPLPSWDFFELSQGGVSNETLPMKNATCACGDRWRGDALIAARVGGESVCS